MRLVVFAMPDDIEFESGISREVFFLFYLFFFNMNTEGNLFFDRYLNKSLPWFENPRKRIVTQLAFIILWTILTLGLPFTAWYFFNGKSFAYPPGPVIIFIGSIIFLLGFLGVAMSRNFFKQWQTSLLKAEYNKQEKLKADYRVLQNQVNPHFLFNCLNVLISEIKHNPNTAVDFTRKLSKVYRYVLQSKNHDLIPLKKELEFIDSFIYLHKVRIGDSLNYSKEISEEAFEMLLPPLTLQILMENAIKHNVANEENVLIISIRTNGYKELLVSNNLQIIENVESTYTGLSNLNKRYELLNMQGFSYGIQEDDFVVRVPLIDQ